MKQFVSLLARPLVSVLLSATALVACTTAPKQDNTMLEKYPGCYHSNPKIVAKCIEKNENGTPTTALQLENTQFPGQYK